MKDTQLWFRVDDKILEYIDEVRTQNRHEFQSQTLRFILEIAREQNLGLKNMIVK